MTDDALAEIDATLEARCGHCDKVIPPTSPSAYFCGSNCQRIWLRARAVNASAVENSEDPEDLLPSSRMRWAPNMVTREPDDDPDLVLVRNPPAFLAYCGGGFKPTVYRRRATDSWHLRLDDGYRFVGRDLVDEAAAQLVDDVWRSLERELTSTRRTVRTPLEPDAPCQCPRCRPAPNIAAAMDSYESMARRARLGSSLTDPERWPDFRWCPRCLQRSRAVRAEPSYHSVWDLPRVMRARIVDPGPACGECGYHLPWIDVLVSEDYFRGGQRIFRLGARGHQVAVVVPRAHLARRYAEQDVFDWLESQLVHRIAGLTQRGEASRPPWLARPGRQPQSRRRRSDGPPWIV